jgi:hypothetical protein
MMLALEAAPAGATQGAPLRDDTPLADLLEVIVAGRELLAVDAHGGGQTAIRLRIDEKVLWTGSRGEVGVALTDQRVLAVAVQSGAWQQASYQRTEVPPKDALLGDRVAVVVTSNRVLGFNGGSRNLVEYALGTQELVLAVRAGENVAVVVTDRRALGLSPVSGGFFQAKLHLHERIEKVTARANLATVTTNRRILIFRGPTGSWEERNLGLR